MNKKKREQRKLIIGGVVVLFLLGAVIALASQLGMFKGYLGSKASICSNNGTYCPGDSCPDGWSYGSDDCYVGISCAQRAIDGCVGHQGSGGGGTGGGGGNGNICERGGVTASACYDQPVDGRCMNFNGQCQKTGTNSAGYATCGCKADTSATPPPATRTPSPTMGCMNGWTKCESNVSYLCQNNGWVRDGKGCSGSTTPPKPTPTPIPTGTGGVGSSCTNDGNCRSGMYCALGLGCQNQGGFNAPCGRNAQCQSGMYCSGISGCQNKADLGTFCYISAQCKSNNCSYLRCSK